MCEFAGSCRPGLQLLLRTGDNQAASGIRRACQVKGVALHMLTGPETLTQVETMKLKFGFFKQLDCRHVWNKDVTYRQLKKDDDKILWVCEKCNKHVERYRWDPPE